ncbi:hypothetical protein [Chthonobacter rhizosphaerae]|uniref:hypothetical protein n=1 Tax=Chthonobacter rhizosphaerae TaxID=2735553 RepID=UPI0015EE682E|nr:hypothetical protein [Chthonobacter rhizosphaerae]
MSDQLGNSTSAPNVRKLTDAIRRVRIADTERLDAVADLHDAEKARLGMLAEELAGVFADIPADDGYFICRLDAGQPPRFWIDPTTHVVIGRDRRTYRLLKDTRLGRVVLVETGDPQAMADSVTDYIAERVVERERALESDFLLRKMGAAAMASATRPDLTVRPREQAPDGARSGGSTLIWALIAFLFGLAAGVAALFAYAWFLT